MLTAAPAEEELNTAAGSTLEQPILAAGHSVSYTGLAQREARQLPSTIAPGTAQNHCTSVVLVVIATVELQ